MEVVKMVNYDTRNVATWNDVAQSRPEEVVLAFNDALNRRDLHGMMEMLSEDCTFENTYPPPDGTRYEGKESIRAFWAEFMSQSRESSFAVEEIFGARDRCVMRWTYLWARHDGGTGHIRGVDLYRVAGSKITEKLSYVKG
jgi:ketosteroid isomerase-like protein